MHKNLVSIDVDFSIKFSKLFSVFEMDIRSHIESSSKLIAGSRDSSSSII